MQKKTADKASEIESITNAELESFGENIKAEFATSVNNIQNVMQECLQKADDLISTYEQQLQARLKKMDELTESHNQQIQERYNQQIQVMQAMQQNQLLEIESMEQALIKIYKQGKNMRWIILIMVLTAWFLPMLAVIFLAI